MHHNPEHHETDLKQAILTLKREYWENETFFVDTHLYPYKLSDIDQRLRLAETEMERQNDLSEAICKKILSEIDFLRTLHQNLQSRHEEQQTQSNRLRRMRKNAYQNIQVLNFVWVVLNKAIEELENNKKSPLTLDDIRETALDYIDTDEAEVEAVLQIGYMKKHLGVRYRKSVTNPVDVVYRSINWIDEKLTPSTDIDEA